MKEKKDYKHGRFNILTTSTSQFSYQDYLDYCEEEGLTPDIENSEAFWDWCNEETDLNFDADMSNIRFCPRYDIEVELTGSVGTWQGAREIAPYYFNTVIEAIEKCLSGDYDKIVNAYWDDGKIEVTVAHHDGTNHFIIRPKDKRRKLPYLYAI